MKRGAFIALLLAGLAYGISYAYIHRKKHGIRRVAAIAGVIAVVIGVSVCARYAEITERWSDIDSATGAGSGREVFWAIIALNWLSAGLLTKFVGFGPHSVFELTSQEWFAGVPAHNDWLMLLHEFGIIGVLAFVGVCWAFAASVPRLVRDCPSMAPAYCAALAGAFCVMLFDIFSYNTETAFFSLLVAVPLGISARVLRTQTKRSVVRKLVRRGSAIPMTAGGN